MKRKQIIKEVAESGLIPAIVGAIILLTDPPRNWIFLGLAFIALGVLMGNSYHEKISIDNGGKR